MKSDLSNCNAGVAVSAREVGEIEKIVNRLQGLNIKLVDIADSLCGVADSVLGVEPRNTSCSDDADPEPNTISHVNRMLDDTAYALSCAEDQIERLRKL